jgi:RNA polymerase sigma factor for flagellar operon FliA
MMKPTSTVATAFGGVKPAAPFRPQLQRAGIDGARVDGAKSRLANAIHRPQRADVPTCAEQAGTAGTAQQAGTAQLLRRYRRTRSVVVRNLIVERYREVVESMARSMSMRLPRSVDLQDLVHAGMWGLMQAIDKFQLDRLDQFAGFVRIRVRGAMLDELRHLDFLPRLYRRRLRDRERAISRLRSRLMREPFEAEVAQELGVSLRRFVEAYGVRSRVPQQVSGASHPLGDGVADLMESVADEANESPIEAIHRQELLAKIRSSLLPVEWQVLQLHYLEGMSGKQVARRLRLSASRICQIHGRVLDRLKQRLAAVAV